MLVDESELHLACDAGQTGIRIVLSQNKFRKEFSFPGILTDQDLFPQFASVIEKALEGLNTPATVSIGSTGLTNKDNKPERLIQLLRGKVAKVFMAHDSVTGLLGSIGLSEGTMTAVGTGVVTLSVGPEMVARVDGWGNLIGDCGSAYWIGRAGLERGLMAYDGRLPETKLLEILWDNFSHPEDAYIDLQSSPNRVARIASFARKVLELASEDAAAMEIVTLAASELSLSAFTAARRSGALASGRPLFSFAGNVMKSEVLRGEVEIKLRGFAPEAVIEPPKGEPIDGVVLLPKVSPTSPLYKEIVVAHA